MWSSAVWRNTEVDVYACWVNVLRRTPYDSWSDQVKADFDGVQLMTTDAEVERYVRGAKHLELFNGPVPGRIKPRHYRGGDEAHPNLLVVTIDPATADDLIFERIGEMVALQREVLNVERKRGRPEFQPRLGRYQLTERVDVGSVKIAIEVIDLLREKGEMSYTEVGEWIAKRYPLAVKERSMTNGTERTKAMSALGSRYVKKGEEMMKAVAEGRFPK